MSKSLYEFLKTECVKDPSERKIYFGRDISGAELLRDVDAVAGFLQEKGIKKGDVVAVCLPNIPQAIVALYAINKAGGIAYVLHPKTGVDFFAEEVEKHNVKVVFLMDRFLKKYKKVTEKAEVTVACRLSEYLPFPQSLERIVEPVVLRGIPYRRILGHAGAKDVEFDGEETAVYLNSGGTTGSPKTIALSGRAFNELALNVRATARRCEKYVEGMGMLMTLPLFHGFGLGVCVQVGLLVGYVIPVPVFLVPTVIGIMKKVPANIIVGVPGMLRKLSEHRKFKGDFIKNIRLIFTGGDKIPSAVKEKFENALTASGCDARVMEGYGLSEVASVATINTESPNDGSLGQPIEGVSVEIFDGGKICAEGETGEIGICSPSVMNGYVDGQEAEFIDFDGRRYLATGDMGYKKGRSVYFVGRKKRMLKVGGVNVFPSQIEEEAVKFPGVKQACAVRINRQGKPATKLLVVTDAPIGDDFKRELTEFIGRSIIKYAEPKIIERVETIKTTAIGKADYSYYENE